MKGDVRCVDGRLMRHDPQHDDPDLETDVGECPECFGRSCEEMRTAMWTAENINALAGMIEDPARPPGDSGNRIARRLRSYAAELTASAATGSAQAADDKLCTCGATKFTQHADGCPALDVVIGPQDGASPSSPSSAPDEIEGLVGQANDLAAVLEQRQSEYADQGLASVVVMPVDHEALDAAACLRRMAAALVTLRAEVAEWKENWRQTVKRADEEAAEAETAAADRDRLAEQLREARAKLEAIKERAANVWFFIGMPTLTHEKAKSWNLLLSEITGQPPGPPVPPAPPARRFA